MHDEKASFRDLRQHAACSTGTYHNFFPSFVSPNSCFHKISHQAAVENTNQFFPLVILPLYISSAFETSCHFDSAASIYISTPKQSEGKANALIRREGGLRNRGHLRTSTYFIAKGANMCNGLLVSKKLDGEELRCFPLISS